MDYVLPDEIAAGAVLQGNEYGWRVDTFPRALQNAPALGYACLDGQFQFRLASEFTCEMYWIDADSDSRLPGEGWPAFCKRSCAQVLQKFERRITSTDFDKEASGWPQVNEALKGKRRIEEVLVFVAYFLAESEWLIEHEH